MNKKVIVAIISLVVIVLVICGCVFLYRFSTGQILQKNNNTESQISSEPLFTLENYPRVDASLATQPLTNAFIKNFVGNDVDTSKIEYTNTHPGYVKLINGEADLIVVTEPSSEELQLAKDAGVRLEVIPVVKEGFVFYVNAENPVENLTLEEIQKIYTGEITNWAQVGGQDAEIRAFQRPVNSGSQTGLLSLVMKDLPLKAPETKNLIAAMDEIVNLVADYDNGKNAIGYSYYYYATTMFEDIDSSVSSKIKFIGVDGVKPTYETIQQDEYKIQTAYYIVINAKEPENSNTRKLVNAMLSKRGAMVAKEAGYVPNN